MAESIGSQSGVFGEELLKTLECPICLKYMTGPIHNCVAGHSICSQCMQQGVKQCPVCKAEFSYGRNFVAEDFAKYTLFPCENKDYGCTKRVLGSELHQHHAICSYRLRNCILDDCKWTGRRSELVRHFTDKHPNHIFSDDSLFSTPADCFTDGIYHYLMRAYGELFLWFVSFNSRKRNITSCVHYIGEVEKSTMYSYTVTLKSKDGRRSLCYTDTTKNDPSSFDNLTESTELFLANEDICQNFTDKDGKVRLRIKISKS